MKKYNCPNCGAPIGYSEVCAYCGTRLDWEPRILGQIIHVNAPIRRCGVQMAADRYDMLHYGKEYEEYLKTCLAKEFLPYVEENMDVRYETDYRRNEIVLQAELAIAQRPDQGRFQEAYFEAAKAMGIARRWGDDI